MCTARLLGMVKSIDQWEFADNVVAGSEPRQPSELHWVRESVGAAAAYRGLPRAVA